jgi:membrane-associated phospholipid phosphatase
MRNSWARAWLAAIILLVAASAIAQGQHARLLEVEEPVMEWLLDDTDASGWERAATLGAPWLIIAGTILLAVVAMFLQWRVGIAVVVASLLGWVLSSVVQNIVERPTPTAGAAVESFPSTTIVQTGVFWGLVVLMLWWVGAPKLVWQIVLELAIVATLLVSVDLILSGEHWPSDAVGSALVIAVSLITAAIVFEALPPRLPWVKAAVGQETATAL